VLLLIPDPSSSLIDTTQHTKFLYTQCKERHINCLSPQTIVIIPYCGKISAAQLYYMVEHQWKKEVMVLETLSFNFHVD
jgi:hypothetical protein